MSKILIVDDDDQLRQTIKMVLKLRGYDAMEADNGTTALEIARAQVPDLIISDINMPGEDGLSALKKIRRDPVTATIPMILMTGEMDSNMRRVMEMGADDFLTKPFAMPALLNAIEARIQNISLMLPHELNTPLVGILGFGEIIYSCADTLKVEELKEMGKNILDSGQRLQSLIQNFLIFAQLEMVGADPMEVESMRGKITGNALPIITMASRASAEANRRDEDLKEDLQSTGVCIAEDLLSKVVEELTSNAFKFSDTGTDVTVSTKVQSDTLVITIADHGRGMRAEHVAGVDSFVQFDRKMHEQQGSGLGLAICKKLTEIHGGKMQIESEVGVGTTVTVTLPAAPQQDPPVE